MYQCPVCKQEIRLTEKDFEQIEWESEVNVKCDCGILNIMVGGELIDDQIHMYSYDVKTTI